MKIHTVFLFFENDWTTILKQQKSSNFLTMIFSFPEIISFFFPTDILSLKLVPSYLIFSNIWKYCKYYFLFPLQYEFWSNFTIILNENVIFSLNVYMNPPLLEIQNNHLNFFFSPTPIHFMFVYHIISWLHWRKFPKKLY